MPVCLKKHDTMISCYTKYHNQVQTTDPFVVVNYLRLLSKNICRVYCGLSICFNNTLVKLTLLLTVLILSRQTVYNNTVNKQINSCRKVFSVGTVNWNLLVISFVTEHHKLLGA